MILVAIARPVLVLYTEAAVISNPNEIAITWKIIIGTAVFEGSSAPPIHHTSDNQTGTQPERHRMRNACQPLYDGPCTAEVSVHSCHSSPAGRASKSQFPIRPPGSSGGALGCGAHPFQRCFPVRKYSSVQSSILRDKNTEAIDDRGLSDNCQPWPELLPSAVIDQLYADSISIDRV